MAALKMFFHLMCLIISAILKTHAVPYNTDSKIRGYGSAKNVLIFGKDKAVMLNLIFYLFFDFVFFNSIDIYITTSGYHIFYRKLS